MIWNRELKQRRLAGRTEVYDPVRCDWFAATPEEQVRQQLIASLVLDRATPRAYMVVERGLESAGRLRPDVQVYTPNHTCWLLAECKEPKLELWHDSTVQLSAYHARLQPAWVLWTNGAHCWVWPGSRLRQSPQDYRSLPDWPKLPAMR